MRRFDALLAVSLVALAAAPMIGEAQRRTASAGLAFEVALTCVLGVAILASFGGATRVIVTGGSRVTLVASIAVCLTSIAYGVFAFVPALMSTATADRVAAPDAPCRTLAPVVAAWLRDQAAFDDATRRAEPGRERALAARRFEEISAWQDRFQSMELPERLDAERREVRASIEALREGWKQRRSRPSETSTTALSSMRQSALYRLRALSSACADEG